MKDFTIIEPRWIVISKEQAGLFYSMDDGEWLKAAGKKVLTNCQEGNIDTNRLLALEISGKNGNTTKSFRDFLGPTDPSKATDD